MCTRSISVARVILPCSECVNERLALLFFFFFLNDTATPEIYPLPLHAPLPIWFKFSTSACGAILKAFSRIALKTSRYKRSEEHTSELQSHSDLVCRLLLEKKKK